MTWKWISGASSFEFRLTLCVDVMHLKYTTRTVKTGKRYVRILYTSI